jgi:hypothetical protein
MDNPAQANPLVAADRRRHLKERAMDEARRFITMFVYLWVILGVFSLHERVILRQEGIGWTSQTLAVVNALVLAKVMLLVEDLRPARWLPPQPLLFPTLFEAGSLTVVFIVFHELEAVIIGLVHGKDWAQSIPAIGGGGIAGLLCISIILFVALVPYIMFRNIGRAIGPERLAKLLLGSAAKNS